MPEVFGQDEISQTARVIWSIQENISVGFSRMPFLERIRSFAKLPKILSYYEKSLPGEQFKVGLN
jgi:hypothetical protein